MVTPSEIREELAKERTGDPPWPMASKVELFDLPKLIKLIINNQPYIHGVSVEHNGKGSKVTIELSGYISEKKEYRIEEKGINYG